MLDLKMLLTTLARVSGERVLPVLVDPTEEGDLCQVSIPVTAENPADKADQALRRYSKDWIKKQGRFNVEAKFQPLKNKSWFDDEGKETPLVGLIVLTWWPQPELSEFDKWEREKAERKRQRQRER